MIDEHDTRKGRIEDQMIHDAEIRSITDAKWDNSPRNLLEANKAIHGKECPVCGCPLLLLAITRKPFPDWRVHCDHCGSEMLIAVLINREAWNEAWKL